MPLIPKRLTPRARAILLGISLLMALVAIAWYAARPTGELRLALSAPLKSDAELSSLAFSVFQRADTALDDALRHHARLSLVQGDTAHPSIEIPPTESPGRKGLSDFITELVVDTTIDTESQRVAVSVDGIAVLEYLYNMTPWFDYYLVVRELKTVPCNDSDSPDCIELIALIAPLEDRPEEFSGTVEDVGRDLAVHILRGAVFEATREWNEAHVGEEPPFLSAASMPARMSGLEHTARGLDILERGTAHSDCRDLLPPECRFKAHEAFRQALASGAVSNPVAAMGLALIEFDRSLRSARALKPDRMVEASLQSGHRWLTEASASRFVRNRMMAPEVLDQLSLVDTREVAFDDSLHEMVTDFRCALASYRRADWAGCWERLEDIATFPAPMRPYIEAAKFEAMLHMEEDDAARAHTLTEIGARIEQVETGSGSFDERMRHVWLLRRVLIRHACLNPHYMEPGQFQDMARFLIDHVPGDVSMRREMMFEVAGCRDGITYPDREKIEEMAEELSKLPLADARYRQELYLSMYYVRTGDLDAAVTHAKRALRLPYAGPMVRNAPAFAPLMADDDHRDEILSAYYVGGVQPEPEECRIVGF